MSIDPEKYIRVSKDIYDLCEIRNGLKMEIKNLESKLFDSKFIYFGSMMLIPIAMILLIYTFYRIVFYII